MCHGTVLLLDLWHAKSLPELGCDGCQNAMEWIIAVRQCATRALELTAMISTNLTLWIVILLRLRMFL